MSKPAATEMAMPLTRRFRAAAGQPLVGQRIQQDGDRDAGDAQGEHGHVACRRRQIGCDDAQHQGQSDADGKGHGQARDVDRRHQQDVRQVEDHAAQKRRAEPLAVGLAQIGQERRARRCPCCPA